MFSAGRLAFIPYIMAGDPDLATTRAVLRALGAARAGAIELGVPYADPLADGPTIAAAGARALARGVGMKDVLSLIEELHAELPPVILFTYYNPVYQFGLDQFARAVSKNGVAGVIVPDITLEESEPLRLALGAHAIPMPLLVAPSTPRDRAARIAEQSQGFIYVVSRLGVTGAGTSPEIDTLRAQVTMLRSVTQKPLAAGFGISSRAQIDAVRGLVDGVIVGSALLEAIGSAKGGDAAGRAAAFVRSLF